MLSSIYTELTLQGLLICSAVSIGLGVVIALIHRFTAGGSKNFTITLAVLPILVQIVMMMVNGNIGTGIAIMGAFSLVRFRSIPGTSREIVSVFFAMAVGLASGTGYVVVAAIATALIGTLLIVLSHTTLITRQKDALLLQITVAENFQTTGEFETIFQNHRITATLERLKTKNMGSVFELSYRLETTATTNFKTLVDDIRVKNNNLPIVMTPYTAAEGGL